MWSDASWPSKHRSFTVSGFSLPVSMTYSEVASVRTEAVGIAISKDAARAFVERLVMQTILGVLEQQGRSALLPDAIISSILDQLRVQINYDALECKAVTVIAGEPKPVMGNGEHVPTLHHRRQHSDWHMRCNKCRPTRQLWC
ncbi:hypothetical protein KIN20_014184 [Parelaphostrongylus tenuis]|uniref:Uncharacterized protein n=1 Tax=Parelaphostrongylus tenuis TaxID=148309 RepID=A0AAD5QN61_PARTN|nr:hypothetical protein KIN20_014184 [Parelaphostrongylus tenuis]